MERSGGAGRGLAEVPLRLGNPVMGKQTPSDMVKRRNLVRNHRAPASLRLSYPGEASAFAVDRGK
jgi:hypothetical protein